MSQLEYSIGLSDAHLRAIGLVAVRWSSFEKTLSNLIWEMANLRSIRGYAVTAHLSERSRVDMCNALADNIFGSSPLAAELNAQLSHIVNVLYPKRNKIVHSTWEYSTEAGKSAILPIKARGRVTFSPREAFSAEDIEAIAEEIEVADMELNIIRRKITELLPTLSNWP